METFKAGNREHTANHAGCKKVSELYIFKINSIIMLPALLLLSFMTHAMHHSNNDTTVLLEDQKKLAEEMIDAFYSYSSVQLAEHLKSAEASADRILYYQGWAEGGNYKVLERLPCDVEQENVIACGITVQDDPVIALKTGFNVTDTFHITFDGLQITQIKTSSNDQPIYFEARAWVEANLPEIMQGPCKNRNTREGTPQDCARAMTAGYKQFYETVVAPQQQ
jgi:hypothetical protein